MHGSYSVCETRGKAGEAYAAGVLQQLGYGILARNFHSRWGEVDIVASKGELLCFVEVKTRRTGAAVGAAAAVSTSKQRKILRTALCFLQAHPEYDLQPRFDVVCVETDGRGNILSHDILEGAFDGEAYGGSTSF